MSPSTRALDRLLHTPGPWSAVCRDARSWSVHSEDYGNVALLHDPYADDLGRQDQLGHDAHLIAAAPDLLEALRVARMEIITTSGARAGARLTLIDAAIAKAEGR